MGHAWKGASVTRLMPTEESVDLMALVEDFAARELAPHAAQAEADAEFPRAALRALGELGVLGLPFDAAYGGGEQPYEVTLQALEELARAWMSIGVSVSVHYLACFPLAAFGTDEQRERWLADMVGGSLLGAYCLSEPHSGSDAAALSARGRSSPGTATWSTAPRRGSPTGVAPTSTR